MLVGDRKRDHKSWPATAAAPYDIPEDLPGLTAPNDNTVFLSYLDKASDPDCCCDGCDWCTFGLTWCYGIVNSPWRKSRMSSMMITNTIESGALRTKGDPLIAYRTQLFHHKWPWLGGRKAYEEWMELQSVTLDGDISRDGLTFRESNLEISVKHEHFAAMPPGQEAMRGPAVKRLNEATVQAFTDLQNQNPPSQDLSGFLTTPDSIALKQAAVKWRDADGAEIKRLVQQTGQQGDDKIFVVADELPDDMCMDDFVNLCFGVICAASWICLPIACEVCIGATCLRVLRVFRFTAAGDGSGVELEVLEYPNCPCGNVFRVSGPFGARKRSGLGVVGVEGGPASLVVSTKQHGYIVVNGEKANTLAPLLKAFLKKHGCQGDIEGSVLQPGELVVEAEASESFNDGAPMRKALNCPEYWTHAPLTAKRFDQMVYVSRDKHHVFDEMLKKTYFAKVTQDRPCPKGTCPKTPGGCPCNKVKGDPGLPTAFQVRRVIRVEDSQMWHRYAAARETIKENRKGAIEKFPSTLCSAEAASQYPEVFAELDIDINEVYLWHGTSVRAALSIAQDDFRIDLAGTGVGTMYGKGAYLAESSTKADEYAKGDNAGNYYENVYALLLCRACMGRYFYTVDRDESAQEKVAKGEFDSTLGDRLKSAGTFREMVIYNNDQLYPEYIVVYERVYRGDDEDELAKRIQLPYHMELPVYWRNVHMNPSVDPFEYQIIVNKRSLQLLQRLVKLTSKGKAPRVVSARRIEHSGIWCTYVQYKKRLRDRLEGVILKGESKKGRFTSAAELDGDDSSGHVKTDEVLRELDSEDCISIDNLESPLNEHMLWHGSSKDAVESIIRNDFRVAEGSEVAHGKRFGRGTYFAEELDKSLSYAPEDGNNRKWVLLCRVACGDQYYVESKHEVSADANCTRGGKDSVLANPEKQGPREFIVLKSECVYPEFCLELDPGAEPDDAWT